MKIRSITVFCAPGFPPNRTLLSRVGVFANHARHDLNQAGYEVQTLRMATPPFPAWLPVYQRPLEAAYLAVEAHAEGFEYLSLGPASPSNLADYESIPAVLGSNNHIFMTGLLNTPDHQASLSAAKACAKVIRQLSTLEPDGFGNLRFAALANVPPYAPFFPAAYAEKAPPSFALAIEGADLAVEAFGHARSLQDARQTLISSIESHAARLTTAAEKVSNIYGYSFRGIDFTLAPFPNEANSIGKALENLGLPAFGQAGSLFASAFLTDTLDQAHYQRVGFNGLMLPVLEDSGLAQRTTEGHLSLQNLLLNSAVCGTGLDVIPLPGDTTEAELYPVLLDLTALALRLNKPLTARLMPIPGKKVGETTLFGFEYFANSSILPVNGKPLTGNLNSNEDIQINPKY
ncbi:MAG: DUF711 family protein [Anaerolineaceae bacterium]